MRYVELFWHVLAAEVENLQLNVRSMLDDEIAWLGNFVPSEATDLGEIDNALLAGHLRFIRTLFSCSSIDKSLFGTTLFLDHSFIEIIQLCL